MALCSLKEKNVENKDVGAIPSEAKNKHKQKRERYKKCLKTRP